MEFVLKLEETNPTFIKFVLKIEKIATFAILGFSKGGLPSGPSMVGLLMFNIHFRNNCEQKHWLGIHML